MKTILGSIIASSNDDRVRFVKFYERLLADAGDSRLDKQFLEAFNASKGTIMSVEELDEAEEDLDVEVDEQEEKDEDEDEDEDEDDDSFIASEGEEEEEEDESAGEDKPTALFGKGEAVLARWRNGRKYYAGEILKAREDGTYDIIYDRDRVVEEGVKAHLVKVNNGKREIKPDPGPAAAKKEKENTVEPTKMKRRAAKKAKTDDSEYGDLDALRAAMLGGSRAKSRAAGFEAFAKKYSK